MGEKYTDTQPWSVHACPRAPPIVSSTVRTLVQHFRVLRRNLLLLLSSFDPQAFGYCWSHPRWRGRTDHFPQVQASDCWQSRMPLQLWQLLGLVFWMASPTPEPAAAPATIAVLCYEVKCIQCWARGLCPALRAVHVPSVLHWR